MNAFGNLSIVGGVAGTSTNAAGGVINVGTATSFLRLSTSLVNDGTINLNAVNAFSSDLQISGNQTISGSGTINGTFDAVSPTLTGNRIVGVGVGDTLTLGTGQTVSGTMNIGNNGTLNVVNNGRISATAPPPSITTPTPPPLSIDTNGTFTNNNILEANGGTLRIEGGTTITQGAGGVIQGLGTSNAVLSVATINGGTLAGNVRVSNFNGFSSLNGVTNTGTVNVDSSSSIRLIGDLTNNGSVNLNTVNGFGTRIQVSGNRTISGSGTINGTFDPGFPSQSGNQIVGVGVGDTLTLGAGQTVSGAMRIGDNGTLNVVNNGRISATTATPLAIDTNGTFTNNNVLEANGGTLRIEADTTITQGAGGAIQGLGTSTVILSSATITGGTLAGNVQVSNFNGFSSLNGVTNTGTINVDNASSIRLTGDLTNNGSVRLNASVGSNTEIQVSGNRGISGAGTIAMTNDVGNRIVAVTAGDTLTIGAGQTISGAGRIGGGTQLNVVNNGTISSTLSNQIQFNTTGTVTNNNLIEANGAGLTIASTITQGGSGTIRGTGTSTVTLSGATINGGTLAGNVQVSNFNGFSNLNGITNTGTINVDNASSVRMSGTNTNNGTLLLGSTGSNTNLEVVGTTTLQGTGTLRLSAGSANNNFLTAAAPGATLVNAAGHTIEGGGGGIALGSALSLVNNGTVRSTTTTGGVRLFLNPTTGTITNNGTFASIPGGHLEVTGSRLTNLSGTTLTGGTYIVGDQGSATTSILRITGANVVTNAANIQLDGAGAAFSRASLPSGVTAGDRTAMTNLATNTAAGSITVRNGANFTTAGALSNAGTITAGPGGSTWTNTGVLTNSGTIQAAGGTINATAGLAGTTGTAVISGTGTLQIGAASTTGTLTHNGGAGSALALGANTLTVAQDYTNANSGVGNAFNARANVTGTGQIVGQNAATAITGQVTATGANTYSLDLGTVRGGTTATRDIQIANTGTGASIRGAIQTTGINDARVGGTAVQAGGSNFGPIAAGANSGNLSVTFNAATTGGSLSGQSLQVVSNFSNVATQTINLAGQSTSLAQGSATPNGNPVNLGNFRVGGAAPTQDFAAQNTTAASALTERLGVGSVSTTGNFAAANLLGSTTVAGGASAASAVRASVSGGTAGVNTGSVTLNYTTDGTQINPGFTAVAANSQTVNLSATGYVAAAGNLNTTVLNFGNVQTGASVSQALSISNTATGPAGFVEDLRVAFGGTSGTGAGQISGAGSIAGLAAGATNAGAMTVSVNTATAGTINGAIAVNYFSTGRVGGTQIAGLSEIPVGSQNFGVNGVIQATGNVIQSAQPLINTPVVNLGNVRVGDTSPSAAVSISNVDSGAAQQAVLNATIVGNPPIGATGAFSGLARGQIDASSLQVSLGDTSIAGSRNGSTATVGLVSDITSFGNCAPNCTLTLPSQTVTVNGGVYQVAQANVPTSVNLGNVRVGEIAAGTATFVNTLAANVPNGFQEGLRVTVSGSSGGASAFGSLANVAAGASGTLAVTQAAAAAGANTGTVTVALASTGAGTSGLADLAQGTRNVQVSATGWTPAIAQLSAGSGAQLTSTSINLGAFRAGSGSGAATLNIANVAADTGNFNDLLRGSVTLAALGGPFTATGDLGLGLDGGQTATDAFSFGIDTSAAGAFVNTARFDLASVNPAGLADLDLDQQRTIQASVFNFAAAGLVGASLNGATPDPFDYLLDFGTIALGGNASRDIFAQNIALVLADLLGGRFDLGAGSQVLDFAYSSAFGTAFSGLGAGQISGPFGISFAANAIGQYEDLITLTWNGSNSALNFLGEDQSLSLLVRANVVDAGAQVPLPSSVLLLALGLLAMAGGTHRAARRRPH